VVPNRDLMERVATLPYFDPDHYESTHDECDMLQLRTAGVLWLAEPSGDVWILYPVFQTARNAVVRF